ncbi:MAG TPA: amidase [Xanthobacteraceae bacterium]|nr:amidase [Xanthobacteraceae bacterium]
MTSPLHHLTAQDLCTAYQAGRLSPVEVTRAVLDRIAAFEGKLNAMYITDAVGALAQAAASEQRWRRGAPLSLIDGVPITIKDNIITKGTPTPLGAASADLTPATTDAPPAARVKEAGCVVLGKTTMPDFGMLSSGVSSFHGITRNPWNTRRNTGGSSSGAGAGVAAGYGPLALGTDIGGSVRLPAAANGIFALKPSLGRVPIYPPFIGRVTGPMTRTVTDSALLMNVLTKPDPRDFMALPYQARDWPAALDEDVKGKRLGLILDIGIGMKPQPAVLQAIEAAAKMFERAGAIVEPVAPILHERMADGFDRFFATRLLTEVDLLPAERQAKILPFILAWCRRGASWSAVDAVRGFAEIMLMREKAVAAIQPFDFLITPTSPITAYAAEDAAPGNDPNRSFPHIGFTVAFNMSEQPAASICAGYDGDGLPIGLQIVGHRFDDIGVLRMARAYETMRPALRPWPEP